jgi:hypothetical protein
MAAWPSEKGLPVPLYEWPAFHEARHNEKRGTSAKEAKRRAWATVNKMTGEGKKGGSGQGKQMNKSPAVTGGKKGGAASASRPAAELSASARKTARTRARNQ